jgi:hypothetical protein
MNWAGMQSTNGWVDGFELSALNDGGMTFANLADVIDKNVKDL